MLLKSAHNQPIDDASSLFPVMAWHWTHGKKLPGVMMIFILDGNMRPSLQYVDECTQCDVRYITHD